MLKSLQKVPMGPVTLETLHKDLQYLNINLSKQYKLRHIIWTSILRGLFTGIGATIVLSLLFVFASAVYSQLNSVPFLHDILKEINIEQVIQK